MTTSMSVRQQLAIISATCQESRQAINLLIKETPSGIVLTAKKVEELTKNIFQEIEKFPSDSIIIKTYNFSHPTIKNYFTALKNDFYELFTKENVLTEKNSIRN